MVGDEDGASTPGQVLPPLHPEAPEGVAPEEELAPEARVEMKDPAVAVERKRQQPDDHCTDEQGNAAQGEVGPEERGEDGSHRGRSALLRPACHDAADLSTAASPHRTGVGAFPWVAAALPSTSSRPSRGRNEVFGTSKEHLEGSRKV